MEFRILGPVEVLRDGERLRLGGPKPRALLAILLLHRNRVVAANRLVELLWGDDSPESAVHSLQVHVSQLRKVLGPERLSSQSPGYLLRAADDEVDSARFEAEVSAAAGRRNEGDLEGSAHAFREAIKLWRGEPFADVASAPFAIAEAARLSELRLRAVEERIGVELELGRHAELIPELEGLVAGHPLRESLCGHLMLALYRCGRQAEASALYYRTRKRLVDELGMEPGPALQALLKDILNQDPELGQLSAPATPLAASNLPHQLTTFIGRQTEITVVTQLLADHRLITLTGPGGIGKTRLAVESARQVMHERQIPAYFIDLAPLTDPALVPQVVAAALGVSQGTSRAFLDTVIELLRSSYVLLVLDNCEHVLTQAAFVAESILRQCAEVRILATSRERLNIAGERVWPISPLKAPDPERISFTRDLVRFEAIQLFVERAAALQPAFMMGDENAPAVARICHSLDGIPLALELAAAQTILLSPEQMVLRLDDRFRLLAGASRTALTRHKTLRATIEWSHNLLEEAEQRLFRRLSVFAASFSLEAVEAVCADEGADDGRVFDALRRLLDASMVASEEGTEGRRYRMLETIRQYSRDRLVESGERDAVCRRLVSFLTVRAADSEAKARNAESAAWIAQMELDHDSLRAALEWSATRYRDAGVRLALAWVPFWIAHGPVREGYDWLSRALREGVAEPPLRAITLNAAGRLALWQGDFRTSQAYEREAIPLLRRYGPPEELVLALINLDAALVAEGDEPTSFEYVEESLRVARANDLRDLLGTSLNNLGEIAASRGELEKARQMFDESLEVYTGEQNLWGMATALSGLAGVELIEGRLSRAADRMRESLALSRRRNDRLTIGSDLLCIANIAVLQGELDRGMRLAGAAESIRRSQGVQTITPALMFLYRRQIDANIQRARTALGGEADALWQQGINMSVDEAIEYAMSQQFDPSQAAPVSH